MVLVDFDDACDAKDRPPLVLDRYCDDHREDGVDAESADPRPSRATSSGEVDRALAVVPPRIGEYARHGEVSPDLRAPAAVAIRLVASKPPTVRVAAAADPAYCFVRNDDRLSVSLVADQRGAGGISCIIAPPRSESCLSRASKPSSVLVLGWWLVVPAAPVSSSCCCFLGLETASLFGTIFVASPTTDAVGAAPQTTDAVGVDASASV